MEQPEKPLAQARRDEELLAAARSLLAEQGSITISRLQRALQIGYCQAKRISDRLYEE